MLTIANICRLANYDAGEAVRQRSNVKLRNFNDAQVLFGLSRHAAQVWKVATNRWTWVAAPRFFDYPLGSQLKCR